MICGGRNDKLSNIVLRDLWVLRLDDLEYSQVITKSDVQMVPRYNHTAVQCGSKLIVFGGMNEEMTLEMTAQEFELDGALVDARIKRDKEDELRVQMLREAATLKHQQKAATHSQQSIPLNRKRTSLMNVLQVMHSQSEVRKQPVKELDLTGM